MLLKIFLVSEDPRTFEDEVHTLILPGKFGGVLFTEDHSS